MLENLTRALDRSVLAFLREAERLIDRGYLAAWFSWLEWTAVTSLIWAIGARTHSWVLMALAAASTVLIALAAVIALQRLQSQYIEARAGAASASAVAAIATIFGTGAIYMLTKALMELLPNLGGG